MESERLQRLRAAFAQMSEEYAQMAAEVDELTRQEDILHRKQQDAVYVRNALSSSVQSLRTAIHNQAAIEQMAEMAEEEKNGQSTVENGE